MTVFALDRVDIANYVQAIFVVYSLIIIAYIIVSLVLSLSGGGSWASNRAADAVITFLRDVSEPYLRLFRRIIPSFGGFDFSPILALIVLGLASRLVYSLIHG